MALEIADSAPRLVVPVLRTPRLVLHGWDGEDIAAYTEMALDPEMSRYTGSPSSEAAVWRMFAFQIGHWALNGFGMWLVRHRATGEFLGRVGLYEEYGWPNLEAAWTIRRDRWQRGYATEGGAAALEFAFRILDHERVISIIHPGNAAGIRVAEKLGMIYAEMGQRNGQRRSIYAINRAEWEDRLRTGR